MVAKKSWGGGTFHFFGFLLIFFYFLDFLKDFACNSIVFIKWPIQKNSPDES
jgi:hypothetical protein